MGRLCFLFKRYFEKKWVGRAMGNETIYWDGLKVKPAMIIIYQKLRVIGYGVCIQGESMQIIVIKEK